MPLDYIFVGLQAVQAVALISIARRLRSRAPDTLIVPAPIVHIPPQPPQPPLPPWPQPQSLQPLIDFLDTKLTALLPPTRVIPFVSSAPVTTDPVPSHEIIKRTDSGDWIHVGFRGPGHPDISEALATPGLALRTHDGSVELGLQ